MHTFEVIVGNVGTVYRSDDYVKARREYLIYVDVSKANCGRAGGENVTLFRDGEPRHEYIGTLHQNDAE